MQKAMAWPWWNWARNLGRRPESGLSGAPVSALLISSDEQYRSQWQRIFDKRGWCLECVPTLVHALNNFRTRPVPLVVYDSLPADEDWRDVLNALRRLPQCPCILLTSSVIDESFGDEVVRLHGYDVFSRHADEDEVARTINSAWFWKHRHV
jgi:ActR/RegA family two-component response regulator